MDTSSRKPCSIEGAIGVALVDYTSGMALGTLGGGKDLDLTVAAAGNTDVVRAKLRTMEMLGLKDEIEDILITLGTQYHLIRLLKGRGSNGLFLYLALDSGPRQPGDGPPPAQADRGRPRGLTRPDARSRRGGLDQALPAQGGRTSVGLWVLVGAVAEGLQEDLPFAFGEVGVDELAGRPSRGTARPGDRGYPRR